MAEAQRLGAPRRRCFATADGWVDRLGVDRAWAEAGPLRQAGEDHTAAYVAVAFGFCRATVLSGYDHSTSD